MTDTTHKLSRLADGRIEAPPGYPNYDGQVVIKTRYATIQRWTNPDAPSTAILAAHYCRPSETLAPKNDHLEEDEISVNYIGRDGTEVYEVSDP